MEKDKSVVNDNPNRITLEELPYAQLQKLGLDKEQVQKMPSLVLNQLMQGKKSPMITFEKADMGSGISLNNLSAKLSLNKDIDGNVTLNIHPVQPVTPTAILGRDISKAEMEILKRPESPILEMAVKTPQGFSKTVLVQYDKQLNDFHVQSPEAVPPPNYINGYKIPDQDKEKYKNGKEIQTPDGPIRKDFNSPLGYKAGFLILAALTVPHLAIAALAAIKIVQKLREFSGHSNHNENRNIPARIVEDKEFRNNFVKVLDHTVAKIKQEKPETPIKQIEELEKAVKEYKAVAPAEKVTEKQEILNNQAEVKGQTKKEETKIDKIPEVKPLPTEQQIATVKAYEVQNSIPKELIVLTVPELNSRAKALKSESNFEYGWDNYSTGKSLGEKADKVENYSKVRTENNVLDSTVKLAHQNIEIKPDKVQVDIKPIQSDQLNATQGKTQPEVKVEGTPIINASKAETKQDNQIKNNDVIFKNVSPDDTKSIIKTLENDRKNEKYAVIMSDMSYSAPQRVISQPNLEAANKQANDFGGIVVKKQDLREALLLNPGGGDVIIKKDIVPNPNLKSDQQLELEKYKNTPVEEIKKNMVTYDAKHEAKEKISQNQPQQTVDSNSAIVVPRLEKHQIKEVWDIDSRNKSTGREIPALPTLTKEQEKLIPDKIDGIAISLADKQNLFIGNHVEKGANKIFSLNDNRQIERFEASRVGDVISNKTSLVTKDQVEFKVADVSKSNKVENTDWLTGEIKAFTGATVTAQKQTPEKVGASKSTSLSIGV